MKFELKEKIEVEGLKNTTVNSYVEESGLHMFICQHALPLCSCSIVVPTVPSNNRGLPHTLEHLIFLGSEKIPFRGFLDVFAGRCISLGTDAYTTIDHTSYSFTTAGFEGFVKILPVFLEYIFRPTLTEANFRTEVYHVDDKAQQKGVVFCEMSGRENTEDDLRAFHFNQLMFKNTPYCFEPGGLTVDIPKLTNDEIRKYHSTFYLPNNVRIILQGPIDEKAVFASLESFILPKKKIDFHPWSPSTSLPPALDKEKLFKEVEFPSEDETVGSVSIGWRGPLIEDVRTLVALEVLFRFLQESPASVVQQYFVESKHPLASSVYYDSTNYAQTTFELIFSGVRFKSKDDEDGEDDEEDDEDDEDDDDDEDEESGDEEADENEKGNEKNGGDSNGQPKKNENLLEKGVMKQHLMIVLNRLYETGFHKEAKVLADTIKRVRTKYLEELEDEPFETVEEQLLPDLIYLIDQNNGEVKPKTFGSRLAMISHLNSLEKESIEYWRNLLHSFMIAPPSTEVIMKPSTELAKKINENKEKETKKRLEDLGKDGLEKCAQLMKEAETEHSRPLPDEIRKQFPSLPSLASIPVLPASINLPKQYPFGIQTVETTTNFYHARICFGIRDLPDSLRPFLTLFAHLLLNSDMKKPLEEQTNNSTNTNNGNSSKQASSNNKGNSFTTVPFTDVQKQIQQDIVSMMCRVGVGSDSFSISYFSEILTVYMMAEKQKIDLLFKWLLDMIFLSNFTAERVQTAASNLLMDLSEESRSPSSVLGALAVLATTSDEVPSNDIAVSIFQQKAFLKRILKQLKQGDLRNAVEPLNKLRVYLVSEPRRIFMQFAHPMGEAEVGKTQLAKFFERWPSHQLLLAEVTALSSYSTSVSSSKNDSKRATKRKKLQHQFKVALSNNTGTVDSFLECFVNHGAHALRTEHSTIIEIGGVETCFFQQYVRTAVHKNEPDFYPLVVLCEILSSQEGPLFAKIRGRGLSYDCRVEFQVMFGFLCFSLYESTNPVEAVEIWYNILKRLGTEEGEKEWLNDFLIETAMASVTYHFHSSLATPINVIFNSLRNLALGFRTPEAEHEHFQRLKQVTKADLQRVYKKYFSLFLLKEKRATLMVCNPREAKTLAKTFKQKLSIDLPVKKLKEYFNKK